MSLVIENIYNVLVTRLSAVEGTTVNSVDVEEVVEPLATGNVSEKNGQFAIVWGDSEFVRYLNGNPPGVEHRQIFNIDIAVRDEDSADAWGLIAERYVSAVVGAVAGANWYTFGGYAVDAEFLTYSHKDDGGITLPLAVTYRTSEYNLTVQR